MRHRDIKVIKEFPNSPEAGTRLVVNNRRRSYVNNSFSIKFEMFDKYIKTYFEELPLTYKIMQTTLDGELITRAKRLRDGKIFEAGMRVNHTAVMSWNEDNLNKFHVLKGFKRNDSTLIGVNEKGEMYGIGGMIEMLASEHGTILPYSELSDIEKSLVISRRG